MGIFSFLKKKPPVTTSSTTANQGQQSSLTNPTPPANTSTTNFNINPTPTRTGGGSSGGGYSYVDTTTGIGYEVSPSGSKTIVPSASNKVPTASTIASQLASKTNNKLDTSTEQGRKSQADVYQKAGLDKFGRTKEYYEQTQREMEAKKVAREQQIYYQNVYNEKKIGFEEANIGLQNVLNVYQEDVYERELKEKGIKEIYKEKKKDYYDPSAGTLISKSIATNIAEEKGYLKVDVIGETFEGGKIIESETGLLTKRQLILKDIYEKLGESKSEIPTNLIIGGEKGKKSFELNSYQLASMQTPYQKSSIERDKEGKILYSGSVSSLSDWTGTGIRPRIGEELNKFGFVGRVVNLLVPKTAGGTALLFAGGVGFGLLPKAAKIGVGGYFGVSGTKGVLDKNLLPEERAASGIIGGLGFLGTGLEISPTIPLIKGRVPFKETPSLEMQRLAEPFSRKRATVMLKDVEGNYLLGRIKTGDIISFGGLKEKGESFSKAGLRELYEETGLRKKDIINYKKAGKVVTPEETFNIFTATLKEDRILKPSSDIQEIVKIKPSRAKNILGKEITGQSILYPITRRGVRSYELGIINYLEKGTTPTWLGINTPKGKYYLGTQSRYDVSGKIQKRYLGEENLLLAHGTQAPIVFRRNPFINIKDMVRSEESKRGSDVGLYVSPPSFIGKEQRGYLGLSYLGFGAKQSESLGLRFGFKPKKVAIVLKESPENPLVSTKKSRGGQESELIIKPETFVKTTERARSQFIGGKRVWIQPARIIKGKEALEVNKLKEKLSKDISKSDKEKIIRNIKARTGIDYSYTLGEYKYINPFELSQGLYLSRSRSYNKREKNRYYPKTEYPYTEYLKRLISYNYPLKELKRTSEKERYKEDFKPYNLLSSYEELISKKEGNSIILRRFRRIPYKQKNKVKLKVTEQERYSPSFTASFLKIKSLKDILGNPLKGGLRIRGIVE